MVAERMHLCDLRIAEHALWPEASVYQSEDFAILDMRLALDLRMQNLQCSRAHPPPKLRLSQ